VVSWDLVPTLGVRPELGRGFSADEEKSGTRVVLISHALWTSQFSGDPAIVGRGVRLSGDLYTVVGVMPPSFRFPVNQPRVGIWTTLALDDDPSDPKPSTGNRGFHLLNVFGRLKPGATVTQADQDLRAIAANLSKQYPNTNTRRDSARAVTEIAALIGDTRTALLVVLGAVALVLLIACGNIANLLLARMRERQREIAVRSALGAGRRRIVRQLLAESLVLSAAGGVAGCGLAFVCTPAILSLIGNSVPRAADAGVDLRVLSFVVFVSLAAGLIFGIVPAVAASKTDLNSTLKEGGRSEIFGRDWLRASLIVGQVALGLVLTAGAGLLVTSFVHLVRTNQGFNPDHLTTLFFETPDAHYKDTRARFYREYFDKLRSLPGVQSAGGAIMLPMTDNRAVISFEDPEHPVPESQQPSADVNPISPEYFHAMQIPLLEGRDFSERDDVKSLQVMIVNQAFAQKFFPGEEVLGKKLKPGAGNGTPGGPAWREIVGVVGNSRLGATQREMRPAMYLPASQLNTWCCLYSVVRTSLDPQSLTASVQRIVSTMDKDIPVTQVRTMNELMFSELSRPRFATILLSTFAGLAIALTIVGLYGVMTYSVSRRTREIGVRMALGAQPGAVLKMVLLDAAILLGAGILIGVAAALVSASVLRDMLYGTGARNPAVLALVCAAVAVAGMTAAFIPAFRAARVDPMVALRYE
jgi:predicted permease